MSDIPRPLPDIYADGLQLTISPFGVILTLALTDTDGATGTPMAQVPVARVRLSLTLAAFLADNLTQALVNVPRPIAGLGGVETKIESVKFAEHRPPPTETTPR